MLVKHSLIIGLGGFVGALLRYLMSQGIYRWLQTPWYPYGTFFVNLLGCLLIGLLMGWLELRHGVTELWALFLIIGVLGGFTTFSSYAYESFSLLRNGQLLAAGIHLLLQPLLGIGFVAVGFEVVQYFQPR